MTEGTENTAKMTEEVEEAEASEELLVKAVPFSLPVTANVKMPVPDRQGQPIPYSNFMVSITNAVFDLQWPEDVNEWPQEKIMAQYRQALREITAQMSEGIRECVRETWLGWREADDNKEVTNYG